MNITPLQLLKSKWNYDSFLPNQERIIQSVLEGKDVLAILPTSAGKSIGYQIPAVLKEGVALVVSPLLALMKDQVQALNAKGISANYISSEQSAHEIIQILTQCQNNHIKLLYVSPERLLNDVFLQNIKLVKLSFITIDEAHCIAEWGHDFRPAYLQIVKFKQHFPQCSILALTATATLQTKKEILEKLGIENAKIIQASVKRKNLAYHVQETQSLETDLIVELQSKESSIVFTRTRKDSYFRAMLLQENGVMADFFHARLESDVKEKKLTKWLKNQVLIMVSTNAFGMGINKNNVRKVIHTNIPQSIEAYVQEVGRAGRDGAQAQGILFYDQAEIALVQDLLQSQIATKKQFKKIVQSIWQNYSVVEGELLKTPQKISIHQLAIQTGISKKKIKSVFTFLHAKEIIQINNRQQNSRLQLLLNPKQLLQLPKKQYQLLEVISRQYPGIYQTHKTISEFGIAKEIQWQKQKVEDVLNQLQLDNCVSYQSKKDVWLRLLRHREDNQIREYYKGYNQLQMSKWKKLQEMIYFVTQKTHCRQVLIQRYFGEKTTEPCGRCDVCLAKQKAQNNCNLSENLLQFLQDSTKTTIQIRKAFPLESKEKIKLALDQLLENHKISLVGFNQFQIKNET